MGSASDGHFALPISPWRPIPTPVAQSKTIGAGEIHAAIERLATAIADRHGSAPKLLILGIANGGIVLARRLAERLSGHAGNGSIKAGVIDISFHRDDSSHNPIPKEFAPTQIPADVNGASIILVDDVLYSGRTVKAALDELFDQGRPTKVELAVLVDRGGRRLPIVADYRGVAVDAGESETVRVHLDETSPDRDQISIEPASGGKSAL